MVDDASDAPRPGRAAARDVRGGAARGAQRRPASRPATSSSRCSTATASRSRAGSSRCSRTSTTRGGHRRAADRRRSTRGRSALRGAALAARPRAATPRGSCPTGACRSCPARRSSSGSHLRFDETLTHGGEDVELVWRAPYVRYEPRAHVAHAHRTEPRAWLARRVYYGRTAARDRQAPPRARRARCTSRRGRPPPGRPSLPGAR